MAETPLRRLGAEPEHAVPLRDAPLRRMAAQGPQKGTRPRCLAIMSARACRRQVH